MALNRSTLPFRSDIFPLRVINVSATLHSHGGVVFADATDWSFHVISHTWSRDIRVLSERIGEILSTQAAQSARLNYSDCFAKPQFAGEAPYEKLIDFLCLLLADGVEKVWFDALCINQTDDGEKAAEIANMGAYYALSAGCYVAAHGIGMEVGFRAVEEEFKLPRWFSRVWTYQESVLPKKLMFIVERFDVDIRAQLQAKLSSGCVERSVKKSIAAWIDWDKELMQGFNPSETYFRRRIVCKEGSMSKRDLYVLGKAAYRDMLHALYMNVWDFKKTDGLALQRHKFSQFFTVTFHQQNEDGIDLEVAVRQIQERECTVEEDRVLGMLGLLGFKGELQVRTKQTLEQQLLWLANMLMKENADLLVNLCAAGVEGYHEMPCASWLPDLRHKKLLDVPYFSEFAVVRSRAATVVGVKQDGKLVMRARSIQGSSIHSPVSDRSMAEESGEVHKTPPYFVSLRIEDGQPPCDNMELMRFDVDSDHGKEGGILMFKATQDWLGASFCIPAPSIHKLLEYKHPCPYTICQLTLLFLGHNEAGKGVIMLCVRDAASGELHKVAVLNEAISPLGFGKNSMALFTADPQEHVIGGFGNNLARFLTKECQEILQNGTIDKISLLLNTLAIVTLLFMGSDTSPHKKLLSKFKKL